MLLRKFTSPSLLRAGTLAALLAAAAHVAGASSPALGAVPAAPPAVGAAPAADARLLAPPNLSCGLAPAGAGAGLLQDSRSTIAAGHTAIADRSFARDLRITADHVTLTNVSVTGRLVITGSHVRVDRVTANEIAIEGGRNVHVSLAAVNGGRNAFSITSDPARGRLATGITLERSEIDNRAAGVSSNGILVRGGRDVTVRCTQVRSAPTGNAAIKLEDTLGGTSGVTLAENRLEGGAYRLRTAAREVRLSATRFEGPLDRACFDDSGGVREEGNSDALGSILACQRSRVVPVVRPPAVGLMPSPASTITSASQCRQVPTRTNTGASGDLTYSSQTTLGDGEVLRDAVVDSLVVRGRNAVVSNVEVRGHVLVIGDGALIDRVTAAGLTISSASDVVVQYSAMVRTPGDGFHVTSDRGRYVQRVRLTHNYVAEPTVHRNVHYDGIQVRGAAGLEISCSTIDAGPVSPNYNAGIYLEDANGGTRDVTVVGNRILGSSWSLMVNAPNTQLIGNLLGGDIRWGHCRVQRGDRVPSSNGNVMALDGAPVDLCRA